MRNGQKSELLTLHTRPKIELRSAIPGRERWDVPCLYRRLELALVVEHNLQKQAGIVDVRANPVTGRMLVRYDPAVLSVSEKVKTLILAVLDTFLAPHTSENDARSTELSLYRLLQTVPPKRQLALSAPASSVVSSLLQTLTPLVFVMPLATAISGGSPLLTALGITGKVPQLLVMSSLGAAIFGLFGLADYYRKKQWNALAHAIEHDMRLNVFAHMQELDMASLGDLSTGQKLHLVVNDTSELRTFFEDGPHELIRTLTAFTLVGTAAIVISPSLALTALLPLPLLWWVARYVNQRSAPAYAPVQEATSDLSHLLTSNLSGLETIKSFTAETYELEQVRHSSEAVRQRNAEAVSVSGFLSNLMQLAFVSSLLLTGTVGGVLFIQGAISAMGYITMVFCAPMFLQSVHSLDRLNGSYQRAAVAAQRLFELLDTPVRIISGHQSLPAAEIRGHITLQNVSFSYDPGFEVLHDITLHIPANATTAIIGPTGSGKTTLIKLILRFYDTGMGHVVIDGIDVRQWVLHDLRTAIGLVSQDVYLFPGTVHENILYGRPDASEAEVTEAARVAEAHDFILQLPQGYETIIGERGQKLSGGQRQRLSIARAILKNAPILILDEATASVDGETEAAIQRSIARLSDQRTIIIIAHRLSTVRHANIIYVLDNGQLREQGDHETLMCQQGLYATLWNVHNGLVIPSPVEPQET
ncbi:ABC transporter ATP-binding protein/permease [Candidatus Entotheonella palauensis]|uniref:ABC transporter ATP-binding protein/permease n=1 Tax=Candidatus Entotheonella palauensis TaxID=93172 RepID=UPI0015C47E3B|nr:ABC transporter ATP-binding protein/permease [Candidatus Entotheonella palauensis]